MIDTRTARRLLTLYATRERTIQSVMSDWGGSVSSECLLTIGQVVASTPTAYRVGCMSVLDKWAEAYAIEASIQDEIREVGSKQRRTFSLSLDARYGRDIVRLEHAEAVAREQVIGWELGPLFGDALEWFALDLGRRLSRAGARELVLWAERLEVDLKEAKGGV